MAVPIYSPRVTPTKVRVLEAAVELLGTEGLRALTHARIDAQAGVPKGSTSNYFRTRAQLLIGVSDWIGMASRGAGASSWPVPTTSRRPPRPPRTWWRAWPSGSRC